MSAILHRQILFVCALFLFLNLPAHPAMAQALLSLQAEDNVIISTSGTTGTYQGKTINSKTKSYTSVSSVSSGVGVVNNSALSTVVLKSGGSITDTNQSSGGYGLAAAGNVIINGGTITSKAGYALVGFFGFSTSNYITINGGTISGGFCGLATNGPTTINGGTITSPDGEYSVIDFSGVTTISGGSFPCAVSENAGAIVIKGGSFNGGLFGGYPNGAINLIGSSFTYTPNTGQTGGGSTIISSGIIPEGSGTITGKLANGQTLNTTYYSGGSASAGLIEVNATLAPLPASPVWGAEVTVLLKDSPIPITGSLVSFDGENITFAKDLTISPEPEVEPGYNNVATSNSFSIQDVASIKLTDPTEFINKYIVQGADNKTVSLQPTAYDGIWHYAINSFLSDDRDVHDENSADISLNAIPRVYGANDPTARRNNPAIDESIEKDLLNAAAIYGIPPQIFYAVAWQESSGDVGRYHGVGWSQFGFYSTETSVGKKVYRDDPVGHEKTLVTYDGGIGMMQITAGTAVNGLEGDDLLTNLYNLASDTAYNIKAGVKVLYTAQHSAQRYDSYLEDSFFAVGRYNGTGQMAVDYRNSVWGLIRKPPYYTKDVDAVMVTSPLVQAPPTSFPAHADVDFDGVIDLILQQPTYKYDSANKTLTVTDLAVPQSKSEITTGDIFITDSSGKKIADLPTVLAMPQKSQVTLGGDVKNVLLKGSYMAHINITLSNGEASEATYSFSV